MSHRGSKAFGFTSECANEIGLESEGDRRRQTTTLTKTKTSTKEHYDLQDITIYK